MTGTAPTLSVESMARRFGDHAVLENVTFDVRPGTVTAVVGPNGSGKTTLLRCVVGAEKPDSGSVRLDGRPIDETDPEIRAAVAALLDDVDFFPDLSVEEHLRLLAFAHGVTEGEGTGAGDPSRADGRRSVGAGDVPRDLRVDRVETIMAELGLIRARDQLPPTLSSGQRRRVALASCFVRPRRLLVLDEPEQRLDVDGRAWLTRRLIREKEAGTAVLMASHDPDVFEAVADQRVELEA